MSGKITGRVIHRAKRVFGTALYGAAAAGSVCLGVSAVPRLNETPTWNEAPRALANLSGYRAAPLLGPGDAGHSLAPTSFVSAELSRDTHRQREIECLALNVYFEARGEPVDGMRAVAHVVMNRVADRAFPSTACDVIRQGGREIVNNCQFSWWCDERSDRPVHAKSWAESRRIASQVYDNAAADPTGGALFYHADYVEPFWRTSMIEGPKIGRHIFYNKPGGEKPKGTVEVEVARAERTAGRGGLPKSSAAATPPADGAGVETTLAATTLAETIEEPSVIDRKPRALPAPTLRRGLDGRPLPPRISKLLLRQPSRSRSEAGES